MSSSEPGRGRIRQIQGESRIYSAILELHRMHDLPTPRSSLESYIVSADHIFLSPLSATIPHVHSAMPAQAGTLSDSHVIFDPSMKSCLPVSYPNFHTALLAPGASQSIRTPPHPARRIFENPKACPSTRLHHPCLHSFSVSRLSFSLSNNNTSLSPSDHTASLSRLEGPGAAPPLYPCDGAIGALTGAL